MGIQFVYGEHMKVSLAIFYPHHWAIPYFPQVYLPSAKAAALDRASFCVLPAHLV
jgi:hypothetical protein